MNPAIERQVNAVKMQKEVLRVFTKTYLEEDHPVKEKLDLIRNPIFAEVFPASTFLPSWWKSFRKVCDRKIDLLEFLDKGRLYSIADIYDMMKGYDLEEDAEEIAEFAFKSGELYFHFDW